MSFQERSTWIMVIVLTLVYSVYFAVIGTNVVAGNTSSVDYRGLMLVTVVVLVVLAAVTHIVLALSDPKGADQSDVRDRDINRFGEYVGGYVLGFGALVVLGLAMLEVEYFWIANVMLFALVMSELVSGVTRIVAYRRGI